MLQTGGHPHCQALNQQHPQLLLLIGCPLCQQHPHLRPGPLHLHHPILSIPLSSHLLPPLQPPRPALHGQPAVHHGQAPQSACPPLPSSLPPRSLHIDIHYAILQYVFFYPLTLLINYFNNLLVIGSLR